MELRGQVWRGVHEKAEVSIDEPQTGDTLALALGA
jgi:hypothetical protein